jgi:hypothetical protein
MGLIQFAGVPGAVALAAALVLGICFLGRRLIYALHDLARLWVRRREQSLQMTEIIKMFEQQGVKGEDVVERAFDMVRSLNGASQPLELPAEPEPTPADAPSLAEKLLSLLKKHPPP